MSQLKKQANSAILAIFPNTRSLEDFKEDCDKIKDGNKILDSFIFFAYHLEIIEKNDYSELIKFVHNNSLSLAPQSELQLNSFSELIKQKKDLIGMKSFDFLAQDINELLDKYNIEINRIKNKAIFTNLQKESPHTPTKRNYLRAMAFWIGYNKTDLIQKFNYENILLLCTKQNKLWNEKEGCRLAFTLHNRGDRVEKEMIDWISSEIKNYIRNNFDKESCRNVKYDDVIIQYIDLFKERSFDHEIDNLISYGKCINNAISMSYQIYIKWALSKYATKKTLLAIGIAAGEFKSLDIYIRFILKEKLPDDPAIRLTYYTRQCILMNEIRVVTSNQPKEIEVQSGEVINVWWIKGLWNTIYWDFVNEMLEDKVLQSDNKIVDLLWTKKCTELPYEEKKENLDAVSIILKRPDNTLFGLEIAKTLYYRQKYYEANEILRIILSRDPKNLIARTLRMSIFWNQGISCDDYSKSHLFFRSAAEEANYIDDYCEFKDEDHYCERGLGKLAHAMKLLRILRQNKGNFRNIDIELSPSIVINLLNEAELIFEKGMTVSPHGTRSMYLILCSRSFRKLLFYNKNFFSNQSEKVVDNQNCFRETGTEIFQKLGWLRPDFSYNTQNQFLYEMADNAIVLHSNANFLQAFIPNAYFCYSVLLWDFYPNITIGSTKKVLYWLYEAKRIAEEVHQKKLCVYSITRFNAEIMKADIFIQHINKIIKEIEIRVSKIKNDDDYEVIEGLESFKISLVNI